MVWSRKMLLVMLNREILSVIKKAIIKIMILKNLSLFQYQFARKTLHSLSLPLPNFNMRSHSQKCPKEKPWQMFLHLEPPTSLLSPKISPIWNILETFNHISNKNIYRGNAWLAYSCRPSTKSSQKMLTGKTNSSPIFLRDYNYLVSRSISGGGTEERRNSWKSSDRGLSEVKQPQPARLVRMEKQTLLCIQREA